MTRARDNATQGGLVLINTTSFTSAATVTINNCFSSTYDNYRLVVSLTGSSNNNKLLLRYIDLSDNVVSSSYYSQATSVPFADNMTSLNAAWGNGEVVLAWLVNGTSQLTSASVDIIGPNIARETITHGNQTGIYSGYGYYGGFLNSMHVADTQFKGIYLFNGSASNMTGSVSIYGMKK